MDWWFQLGHRDFPWRRTRDPHRILIAEIMLHRTKAEQVALQYEEFLEAFPDLVAISKSSPAKISKRFAGLGLRWRWKLLHEMAGEIITRFFGEVPWDFQDLISLPGIGNYIASAVRCFAFGFPDVVLDTNTTRVVGRVFGLPISDNSRRSADFRRKLEVFVGSKDPRSFNFALIDFAARICKPNPKHEICPISSKCAYFNSTLK